ncbi:hypothetical protein NPIL_390391 [Nephila pilipes]|uniref:Uncharacterized protein n=1 Tax=Nephila pilipes TaxID=299642 RepID=A0A8X6TH66_NEPPI|nr:hypothetical protein NPIL_390391 [Nephila pilipes]
MSNLLLSQSIAKINPYKFWVLLCVFSSTHAAVYRRENSSDQDSSPAALFATAIPEDNWSALTPISTELLEDRPAADLLKTCPKDEFQCHGDKRCIPQRWRCDKEADCEDASDESDCDTDTFQLCQNDQFKCHGKDQCIPLLWRCNGRKDCEDDSDEKNCTPTSTVSCEFHCEREDLCIPQRWRCDGVWDCTPYGSDEENCTSGPLNRCQRDQFMCRKDGICIPESWRCDGVTYCRDGSDESNCSQ